MEIGDDVGVGGGVVFCIMSAEEERISWRTF